MTKVLHSVAGFFGALTETKRAIGVLAGVMATGILVGGVLSDVIFDTPEKAERAVAMTDSLAPLVSANVDRLQELERLNSVAHVVDDNRDRISNLETGFSDREDRLERIERRLDIQVLNGCLTLSELRAVLPDACRTILDGRSPDEEDDR